MTVPGPLSGVRVLDFTHVWAGPLATRILADLGADVIKVEAPWARGVASRPQGTTTLVEPADDHWNRQGPTNKLNRNKRGLCLDSKSAAGHGVLLDLVREVDVVIENFSARAMASMGLGWDVLRDANPNVIYVAMPGFGVSGPNRSFVAFGPSVEPMCGLTSVMGYSPEEPRVTAMAVPDPCGGVTAAAAVLTALHRRDQTGRGGFVELALQEAAIALFGEYILLDQMNALPERMGNAHADHAPHGVYRCQGDDAWIALAAQDDADWLALRRLIDADWCASTAFATLAERQKNRDDLDTALEAWTSQFDAIELADRLQDEGIAAGPVYTAPEFMNDPQVLERGYFTALPASHMEPVPYPGLPVRLDGERGRGYCPAPRLGEHNREILSEVLGLGEAAIDELTRDGVLFDRPPDTR